MILSALHGSLIVLSEALEKIKKYHKKDEEADNQLKQAKAMLESSKDQRQEAKERLDTCTRKDWTSLERMIKSLSVSDLNEDVSAYYNQY